MPLLDLCVFCLKFSTKTPCAYCPTHLSAASYIKLDLNASFCINLHHLPEVLYV